MTAWKNNIAKEVAADNFPGAVIIAKNGSRVLTEAYGLADRERKIPNPLKTRFWLGSVNRMFTTVATLELELGSWTSNRGQIPEGLSQ